jgi:hypothetical protein
MLLLPFHVLTAITLLDKNTPPRSLEDMLRLRRQQRQEVALTFDMSKTLVHRGCGARLSTSTAM